MTLALGNKQPFISSIPRDHKQLCVLGGTQDSPFPGCEAASLPTAKLFTEAVSLLESVAHSSTSGSSAPALRRAPGAPVPSQWRNHSPLPLVKCISSSVLLFVASPAPSDPTRNIHSFTVPLCAEQQRLHPCMILYIYNKPHSLHTQKITQEM